MKMLRTAGRKRRPPRLEKPVKQYALHDCALYGLKGLGQLAERLKVTPAELTSLTNMRSGYSVWTEDGRAVQAARPLLRRIHARIATLLRRVAPPSYRHSGIRERSFISNALEHVAPHASLKLDIKKFYPSTTVHHVWKFFALRMKCAHDVAAVLAAICCYQRRHLPTGGVHSEVLAFYCHLGMFEALNSRVLARGGVMSAYVDDIVITMPSASHSDLRWAERVISCARLTMNARKSRLIKAKSEKLITGVRIYKGEASAPAGQHRKVKQLHETLAASSSPSGDRPQLLRSLQGHLDHIGQIEQRFVPRALGHRQRNRVELQAGLTVKSRRKR